MRVVTMLFVTVLSRWSQSLPHARVLRLYEGKLNLNAASAADLTRLPGIGEIIAFRIVKERESPGAFRNIDELQGHKGCFGENLRESERSCRNSGREQAEGYL